MAKVSRRDFLVLVAAGVGTAAALESEEFKQAGVALPIGEIEEEVGQVSGPGSAGPIDADLEQAATLGGLPSRDVSAYVKVVTGDNRDYGFHAEWSGSLPVTASASLYQFAIVDAIGDVSVPSDKTQFAFVVGDNRDYGMHIRGGESADRFAKTDEYGIAFASALVDITSTDERPEARLVYGNNRDYGGHIAT